MIAAVQANASPRVLPYFERAIGVAGRFGNVFDVRPALYRECLKPIQVDSRETVPVAMAMFMLAGGDPMTAAIGGANFGRDSDTIAGMAGLLSGALKGIDAIDPETYSRVTEANGFDLESYASRLAAVT